MAYHHTNGATAKPADSYSVPDETDKLFKQGILANPLIQKDLPPGYEKYAAPISFSGSQKPCIPINWRFAESVSALKALEGTLVNALLSKKYGVEPQNMNIDTDHAQLFFMSIVIWTITHPSSEKPLTMRFFDNTADKAILEQLFPNFDYHRGGSSSSAATNIYKTSDERYFHLHGSLNAAPSIESIGLPPANSQSRAEDLKEAMKPFEEAMRRIDSADMQHRASDVFKQAGTICWTMDEFKNSDHGKANAHVGLFDIHKAPSYPAQKASWWPSSPLTGPARPLAGLKVVDITRIIAAPAVTRGLAELGASVMRVTAAHLPDLSTLHPDLNWGKWNCHLDLREEADRKALKDLILEADVVVSGYRPGVMEKWGFAPNDIFELCKGRERGIVVARENCYGWNGPWQGRSGWQQISDANTGVSMEFGRAMGNDEPVTPVFPNSDFCTGIAGTCGIITALLRRGEEGGSYRVDLALNYYSQWLVNSVGTYPEAVWKDVWARNGNQVFRHYDNMSVTIPAYMKMLQTPGAPGNAIFNDDFFEDRNCENLTNRSDSNEKITMRTAKPILRFPDGQVKPGFHISTRGNGADAAKWPKDLTVQVVS